MADKYIHHNPHKGRAGGLTMLSMDQCYKVIADGGHVHRVGGYKPWSCSLEVPCPGYDRLIVSKP